MSYIIAATDFSNTSNNAIKYAANLAVVRSADLVIIYSFAFPVMVSDVPLPASLIDDTQHDAENKIKALEKKISEDFPDINIKGIVNYGSVVESIEKYAANNGKPWLTVMGNTNTSEEMSWFFSTLKEAARHLNYSVLAVPPMAHYKPLKKICFGLDLEHPENKAALKRLAEMSRQLQTELHVVNAQANGFDRHHIPEINGNIKEALGDANPFYHFRYDADIDNAIREFCSSIGADWFAIQPGVYSFVEGLFHKSHTKALASTIDIPLLILHEGN